jgi:prepilin-type N-terminal cleavage/methylation domain-containing protein/prepilin-type processing-associated H-X9-DG protein
MKHAFTLIEILVVIGIISILAAILFPVFAQARRRAQATTCLSNLRQLGTGILLYAHDYDDLLLWGADPSDLNTDGWRGTPDETKIFSMQPQHLLLEPYIKNRSVFHCPLDIGFEKSGPFSSIDFPTSPSSYKKWGTSYYTYTSLVLLIKPISSLDVYQNNNLVGGPESILFLFDGGGHWHGNTSEKNLKEHRFNIWFLDGHVSNKSRSDFTKYLFYNVR